MWVLPSRARPLNCARLFAVRISTPGILVVDDDDPLIDAYKALALPFSWRLAVGSRGGLAELYNRQFREHLSCRWYGLLADDVLPETEGWDTRLVKAAGRDWVAYADDGIGQPTHPVIGGDLVREVGWLALPGLARIYIDTVWAEIAKGRGVLRYLPDVKLTHLHFSQGAPFDKTYEKPGLLKAADRQTYEQWRDTQ